MQWQNGVPEPLWDDALFAAGGHFLQSSHWAAFNAALGKKVFYAQGDGWQCLALLEPSRAGTRLYCPYGPLTGDSKSLTQALGALRQLGKQHGAVFVRAEPTTGAKKLNLASFGLKPAFKNIQPRLTWTLNLGKPQDELLADMTATNRNLWRTHTKKELVLRASTNPADIRFFIKMMREVAARNAIVQHSDHYYQTMAETLLPRGAAKIYLAEHQGKPMASALCLDSPTTRYYTHAASHFAARKLHPGTPLLAQMIFDAKNHGQQWFDFVGVAPADAPSTHRWAGLTKFKQSFGGEYKTYPGTWELPVNQLRHTLYRSAYKTAKLLRGQ